MSGNIFVANAGTLTCTYFKQERRQCVVLSTSKRVIVSTPETEETMNDNTIEVSKKFLSTFFVLSIIVSPDSSSLVLYISVNFRKIP